MAAGFSSDSEDGQEDPLDAAWRDLITVSNLTCLYLTD